MERDSAIGPIMWLAFSLAMVTAPAGADNFNRWNPIKGKMEVVKYDETASVALRRRPGSNYRPVVDPDRTGLSSTALQYLWLTDRHACPPPPEYGWMRIYLQAADPDQYAETQTLCEPVMAGN